MESDAEAMHMAVLEGEKGRLTAPPNPWVGCVISKNGSIIGRGFHHTPGTPHAEILALKEAGEKATGATVYVTLEPCSHQGRTGPCAKALIEAKVARVVIGVQDPDLQVSGEGIALLRRAGIDVTVGVATDTVERSLRAYLHHRKAKRPFFLAKSAPSIDGKIAAPDGSSQWITTEEARADAHHLRASSQAILIGSGTAVADAPRLTVREQGEKPPHPPLRVVLDSSGRIPLDSPLLKTEEAPTLIVTTPAASSERLAGWREAGAEVEVLPAIDLYAVTELLYAKEVLQILVEGGGLLMGSLLKANLIDQLTVYRGPRIIGEGGVPMFGEFSVDTLEQAPTLRIDAVKQIGDVVRIDYLPES